MYTFLVKSDNSIEVSVRAVIMQRSSLVDSLHILVERKYGDYDMCDFVCMMEYKLPVSNEYKTLNLVANEELYKDNYVEYVIDTDTDLTSQAGDVEFQLTFCKVELEATVDDEGNEMTVNKQFVRKTRTAKLHITSIAAWSDLVPDTKFTAIDQRLIKAEAILKGTNELAETLSASIPTDINLDTDSSKLQLVTGTEAVGDGVDIATDEEVNEALGKVFE